MNVRIAQWQREHANFSRLLDLVEARISLFHRGEQPDYELLLDVIHYMTHYPDRHHHPQEDLACELLLARDSESREAVGDLAAEHARIAAAGSRLVNDLEAIRSGAFMARSAVEKDAEAYLHSMRENMQREEANIFPRLDRVLQADDWAQIDARLQPGTDPIFGASVDQRYAALYRSIAEQAGCDCPPGQV